MLTRVTRRILMEKYNSIAEHQYHIYDGRIITFGLTDEENHFLSTIANNRNFEVYDTNVATDLVAILAIAIIVNASKLETDSLKFLINYYTEVNTEAEEFVFWIGSPKPSIELQMLFHCFDNFEEIAIIFEKIVI